MHIAMARALADFPPQVRQPNISTVALNQSLLSVLASSTAFLARQANQIPGVFSEL
jgi:hypothetical protein